MDSSHLIFKSSKSILIHGDSHIPRAIALNSPPAFDLTATFCFLLVRWAYIIYISVKFKRHSPFLFDRIVLLGFLLSYCSSLFTTSKWISLGFCLNFLTTLTTNTMSGVVWARYMSFLTSLWYISLYIAGYWFVSLSLWFKSIAVDASLHVDFLVSFKRSVK